MMPPQLTPGVQVYTTDQVAALLACSPKTVEEWARDGRLAGIKPSGAWVFPAGALAKRLDELALEEAAARRAPPTPGATTQPQPPAGARKRAAKRPRPQLVDLRAAPARS